MSKLIYKLLVLGLFGLCGLSGCGGSGGSSPVLAPAPLPAPPPTGGIGRLGFAAGTIANFGSIYVNGVIFNTDTAVFTVDDQPGSQSDLSVGDFVIVKGDFEADFQTATATEVIYNENVKGPVQSINSAVGSMVVLGQTVTADALTSFDDSISPRSLDGLSIGDIVEISGLFAADGSISASRIERKPAGTPFEVFGTVANHNSTAMTFTLAALSVDYSNAILDNFTTGQITDGDFVEAKGLNLNANGELVATKVELENATINGATGDRLEIEGFISRFVSATDFDVAGLAVTTSGTTVFEGGVAADLGLNTKVEVEGNLNSSGVLVADKVDIRRPKVIRVEAAVDSVDVPGNNLVILGITFNADTQTRFEDKSDAEVEPLTLSDINAGDYLEVSGAEFPAGSGNVLMALLEREDLDTDTILQGFVSAVSDPALTVLGVTIETTGNTIFFDAQDNPLTKAEFFSQVTVNSLIKAKGTESSVTTIIAEEVEFEDET